MKLYNEAMSNAQKHLDRSHKGRADNDSSTAPSQSISQVLSLDDNKQRHLAVAPNPGKYRNWLLRWWIEAHIPLDAIEHTAFKMMQRALNPMVAPYVVTGRTLSRWAEEDVKLAKEKMRQVVWKGAVSQIHISCDVRTTPEYTYAILGVVAHCVMKSETDIFELKDQAISLALHRVEDQHDQEGIGEGLLSVLRDFDIEEKVGVFICDNPMV